MKNAQKKRSWNWERMISLFVLISMVLAIVAIIVIMFLAPSQHSENYPEGRIKSDYVLMLIQCMLGLILMILPSLLERKWSFAVPNYMYILFFAFLYCAIYLGEVRSFYYLIPHWDTILHAFSGVMLGALGFSLVTLLNSSAKVSVQLSPFFVALFAFCFALAMGALWEIYEFSGDSLFGMNMQKYREYDGTVLIGHAALIDTMKDVIIDALAALAVSIVGFIGLKHNRKMLLDVVEPLDAARETQTAPAAEEPALTSRGSRDNT